MQTYIKSITERQAAHILMLGDRLDFGAISLPCDEYLNKTIRAKFKLSFNQAEELIRLVRETGQLYSVDIDNDLTKEQKAELKKLTADY